MGPSWRFVVAWLSAAVAAVTVSWLGVRLGVAPAITDEPPVAIDVNRRYTDVRFGPADTAPPTSAPTTSPGGRTPTPSRTPAGRATSRSAPSRQASATPSASPSPSATDRRPRYRVEAEAGDLIVAYSATRIDVVGTDPLPGYEVTAARRSNTLVVVRLAGAVHASVVTLYWNAGPAAQIAEEYSG